MNRLSHSLIVVAALAWLAVLAGCATADQAHTGQLASVEVGNHSYAEVREATIAVFLANGYEQGVGLVFEKKGSLAASAIYGGWSANAVWTRIKVAITTDAAGQYVVGCDAYLVKDRNEWILEEEQKNFVSKRSECERLLKLIKTRLETAPAPSSSGNPTP